MPSSSSAPRIALGGIIHETHSFAETLTTLDAFKNQTLHQGDDILRVMTGTSSAIGGMIQAAGDAGWTLKPTVYAAAMPAGIVKEGAYQTILQELLDFLAAAMPLDGVLLALHGAMVTESHLDPESHILEQVRQTVGSQTPIVVVLDMHGNITPQTVELADVLVAFETNPHVDPFHRGIEAANLLARLLSGRIQPTSAYVRVPLLLPPQATGTDDLPLLAVHERAAQMKQEEEVLCICVMGGFAYADTPAAGASLIVTTNNNPTLAQACALELAEIMMSHRQVSLPKFLTPNLAVAQAMAHANGPIILVDSADNIGGGTPGDGTDALRALLTLGAQEATVVLADPQAVNHCWAEGSGSTVTLPVGGKSDRWHGEPVTVTGVVQALSPGVFECELPDNHFASFYGNTIRMGRTVWLRVDGINIILTEQKTPPFDLAQLRGVGIIPEKQKMIVVKSAVAYRAAYLPIAAGVIEMDTSGLCTANLSRFPYRHLRYPIYPFNEIE